MKLILYSQAIYPIQLRISNWGDAGLYQEIWGFFLSFLFFLLIYFFFFGKSAIFVISAPYNVVFDLVYLRFDKRKPVAGYFKLHRLLYFIRAVFLPTPAGSRKVGVGQRLHSPCNRRISGNRNHAD